jgi:Caspase domain
MKLLPLALALAVSGVALDAHAARLALVVGNDSYQNATPLKNARNDAQALARELEAAGFKVTRVLDASRDALNDALDAFLQRIEKGDEVVFYFSGHGSQPPQLGPFLLPVDIRVTGERAIQRDGLSLEQVTDDLNKRARFTLVIVDACRDDPFRQTVAGRALAPGSSLSRIEPPKGTMVIMAASKGQQALDNLGRADAVANGLFTRELIKQMRSPGLSASDMLRRVRGSVEAAAASVNHAQRPSLVDESSSDFFFYPAGTQPPELAPAVAVAAPSPAPAAAVPLPPPAAPANPPRSASQYNYADAPREFDAWESAVRLGTRAAFESFVEQYPNGRYAHQARTRLAGLGVAPAPTSAPRAPSADPQVEREVWERAVAGKRKVDYESYLSLYPNGRWAEPARAALKRLDSAPGY